jgi:hypothetical protein
MPAVFSEMVEGRDSDAPRGCAKTNAQRIRTREQTATRRFMKSPPMSLAGHEYSKTGAKAEAHEDLRTDSSKTPLNADRVRIVIENPA